MFNHTYLSKSIFSWDTTSVTFKEAYSTFNNYHFHYILLFDNLGTQISSVIVIVELKSKDLYSKNKLNVQLRDLSAYSSGIISKKI